MFEYVPMKGGGYTRIQLNIDRERTCPTLLRVFIKEGDHHSVNEFSRTKVPQNDEIQLYTWKDATLKEITNLIKESHEASRNKESIFDIKFIYPDSRGTYISKSVGKIYSNKKTEDDYLTLQELAFNHQYLDISLSIPSNSATTTTTTATNKASDSSPTLSN